MDRRSFLKMGAAGLALSAVSPYVVGADAPPKRMGLIGSGWYGKSALLRFLQVAPIDVVAICDVDETMRKEAAKLIATRQVSGKEPRLYHDYRQMLAKEKFDIVQVSTPDHWHALAAIAAMKAGADVYCEKPISVDIVEGQAMVAAAEKYGRIVQINTQRRSTPHLIDARDKIIRTGKLGTIGHVEVYCYYHMRTRDTSPPSAPPPGLDFDFWTGPAPLRPFHKAMHPRGWRAFKEYGNGILGDMCVHMLDTVRWMLELGWPIRVSSTGGILVDKASVANVPDTQMAAFDFGDLEVIWQHRTWGKAPDPSDQWGMTFYGDKGTLKASVHGYEFIPQNRDAAPISQKVVYELEEYPEDKTEEGLEKHVAPAMRRHIKDFLASIETRKKPVASVDDIHITTASCILANMALETGRTLEWDPAAGRIVNDPEANKLLARPYRAPWIHPTPATV